MASFLFSLMITFGIMIIFGLKGVNAQTWENRDWTFGAHATFYGGQDAFGTMGGACGYGDLYSAGYGIGTTALSNSLFNNGLSCGSCFQLVCVMAQNQFCYANVSIIVTVTNKCPPGSEGGWCDLDGGHFDLSYPMFSHLAQPIGGVIPVVFRRVSCNKSGGIRFTMNGNPWFDYVLIHNVADDGSIKALSIKGDGDWIPMTQNWGAYWEGGVMLQGQSLSFMVTSSTGKQLVCSNVAPSDWAFGQTFECDLNF